MRSIRALIVDDEAPARAHLRTLLEEVEGVEIVGEASNAVEAEKLLRVAEHDVVFLDIRMPGMDGVRAAELYSGLPKPPFVVFTTAYEEYAQQAFDVDAIDYLLKPISKDRLRKCIRKVVGRLHVSEGATYSEEIRSVTDASGQEESREYLTARQGHRMVLIATEDIVYVQVEREEVNIFTREDRYEAMVSSLDGLERALDASSFFRTHRNYLVNLRHVSEVVPMFNRTYELVMTDAQESRVPVSRRRAVDLRAALGF